MPDDVAFLMVLFAEMGEVRVALVAFAGSCEPR